MKKALIVTSVPGFITNFEMNNVKILKQLGYLVDVATNVDIVKPHHTDYFKKEINCVLNINFNRSPFSLSTIKSYNKLKQLLSESNYDLVHCHTPVAGVLTRLAARKYRSSGLKVIYTAHGFHFFKGAPLINWILYYNCEKYCAKFTDTLVTMNQEDFNLAVKKFKCQNIELINGVGLSTSKFSQDVFDINQKKESLGIKHDDFIILSIGELIPRKNHILILKALKKIKNDKVKLIICGEGILKEKLSNYINKHKLNAELLGYRTDISEICRISDLFIFPSIQEGLPVALMEAKHFGLPIICTNIRGNVDLITSDNKYNKLIDNKIDAALKSLNYFISERCGKYNQLDEIFYEDSVNEKMLNIYKK